jgi:hypothetical protein
MATKKITKDAPVQKSEQALVYEKVLTDILHELKDLNRRISCMTGV